MDNLPSSNSGQALLIVLLSMAVILTIVLSILSRSVTDVAVTSREEEALRAFSAAEAGVERAILIGSTSDLNFGDDASFVATAVNFAVSAKEYIYPDKLFSGESATIWFVDHDEETRELTCDTNKCFTGSGLSVCWAESETPSDQATTPALEISILYVDVPWDYSTVKIARVTADPNVARRVTNNFGDTDGVGCTLEGQDFEFKKTIDFSASGLNIPYATPGNLLIAKIRFFYNTDEAQTLGFDVRGTGGDLPSQGRKIVSTGTAGEANRKIEVLRTFGELPPIFDAAVFSPGGIVK
jgi:type II secretory pathway pseudopilin PulG